MLLVESGEINPSYDSDSDQSRSVCVCLSFSTLMHEPFAIWAALRIKVPNVLSRCHMYGHRYDTDFLEFFEKRLRTLGTFLHT